jgi:hypothetical protein
MGYSADYGNVAIDTADSQTLTATVEAGSGSKGH